AGAGLEDGLLPGMELPIREEPFDRDDVVPLGLSGEQGARADELAVEQNRARAALALLARVLGARQAEPLTQRKKQALALPHVRLVHLAVDAEPDLHVRHLASAREVSTWRACRR